MRSIPAAFFAVITCGAGLYAGPIFDVIDLGSLGDGSSVGFSVNNAGVTVGQSQNADLFHRAFVSSGAGPFDLTPGFASEGGASAINDAGQIAGTIYVHGQAQAVVWNDGVAETIGGTGSYAMGINSGGDVAGAANGHPFLYAGGQSLDLGLPAEAIWASAYGVNSSSAVAGYSMTATGGSSAFVWTASGGFQAIGTLGGGNSYAMAINDAGGVVGAAGVASGYLHAFLYDGSMRDLGTLGGNASYAYAINGSGSVVGYSLLSDGRTHAFLYANGVLVDLNDLIGAGAGWQLTAAYGINDAGQIVGTGIFDGVERAFRLDPTTVTVEGRALLTSAVPEPGTLALVLLGLALVVWGALLSGRVNSRGLGAT